jgi:beta-N-acetylhexosaminidase
MLDLKGTDLLQDEVDLLRHPLVGGVILTSRNYQDPGQLLQLTGKIHALRQPALLIAVDHEGGRVQRFRDQFTRLPACRRFGQHYDGNHQEALKYAEHTGWLLASELQCVGVDFSFAPVLDLDTGNSGVIGDRAFHHDPGVVAELARAFTRGMKSAGMAAVGKHFPGHGYVREDSHESVPVDTRSFEDIAMRDLVPFERLAGTVLAGIMPAHVIYPEVDANPAGFSEIWLGQVLRRRLGFQGAIFSDDICMAGAGVAGDYPDRAHAALAAGCDMVLVCNNPAAAVEVLEVLKPEPRPLSQVRLMRMYSNGNGKSMVDLKRDDHWHQAVAAVALLDQTPELDFGDDEIRA